MNYLHVTIAVAGAATAGVISAGTAAALPDAPTPIGPEYDITNDGGLAGIDTQTLGYQDFSVFGDPTETFTGAVLNDSDVFGGSNYNVDVYADPTGNVTDGEQYNYFIGDGFGEEYNGIGVTPEADYITPFGDINFPTSLVEALGPEFFEPPLVAITAGSAATDLIDPSLFDIGSFLP